ncbi:DUF2490 domain-containing protein [Sphingomonas asaccharolytica]|uniref:DUF2490 domain-containing protein n=1 Tax=Sphingomonas asaccharolytica TaxID=40681 RepID=UPI0008367057|nr:DUF2490 domain-containing protein [Sphingomonas asaccharolytica]
MTLRVALLAAAIALPGEACAKEELWTGAGASGSLGGDWRGSVDGIARFGDGGLYEWVASVAVGRRLDDHATLWAGYVYKTAYADHASLVEQRLREEISLDDVARIGPVRIGGRLRTEQRWREATPGLGWRVRSQLRLTLPLRRDGPALVAGAEGFFNLDRWGGQRAGYERIRESIGVQIPLMRKVRLDLGYLRQWTRATPIANAATMTLSYRW